MYLHSTNWFRSAPRSIIWRPLPGTTSSSLAHNPPQPPLYSSGHTETSSHRTPTQYQYVVEIVPIRCVIRMVAHHPESRNKRYLFLANLNKGSPISKTKGVEGMCCVLLCTRRSLSVDFDGWLTLWQQIRRS